MAEVRGSLQLATNNEPIVRKLMEKGLITEKE